MPTVAAIGISAGVGIYSAHKNAQASKQASNVQVQTSDKAMAYQQAAQKQAMDFAVQMRNAPLRGPGPAQSYLSHLMGVPGGSSSGATAYSLKPQGQDPNGYMSLMARPGTQPPTGPSLGAPGMGQPSMGMQSAPPPSGGLGAPGMGQPGMGQGAVMPKVGDIKVFPNGNRGRWDGQGWEHV